VRPITQEVDLARRWRTILIEQAPTAREAFAASFSDMGKSLAIGGITPHDAAREFEKAHFRVLINPELLLLRGDAAAIVADAAMSLPAGVTYRQEMFPSPVGLVFIPEDFALPCGSTPEGLPLRLRGLGWFAAADTVGDSWGKGFALFAYGDALDNGRWRPILTPITTTRASFGEAWGQLDNTELERIASDPWPPAVFTALLVFMQQRLLVRARPGSIGDRSERRRLARAPNVSSHVVVIVLRGQDTKRGEPGGHGHKLTVRHIRAGHWHSYWIKHGHDLFVRGGDDEQLIAHWLLPTVVGDPSLPFRPPDDPARVFDVRR